MTEAAHIKLEKAEAEHDRQFNRAEAVHGRQFQRMFEQVTDAGTLLSTALDLRARAEQLLKTSLSNEDKLSRLGHVKFLTDRMVTLSEPTENFNDQQPSTPPPRIDRKGTFGICDHCCKFRLPCDRKLECETCKGSRRQCTRNDSAVGTDSRTRKAVSEDCDLCRATYTFDHNDAEEIEEVQPIPIIRDGEAQCVPARRRDKLASVLVTMLALRMAPLNLRYRGNQVGEISEQWRRLSTRSLLMLVYRYLRHLFSRDLLYSIHKNLLCPRRSRPSSTSASLPRVKARNLQKASMRKTVKMTRRTRSRGKMVELRLNKPRTRKNFHQRLSRSQIKLKSYGTLY